MASPSFGSLELQPLGGIPKPTDLGLLGRQQTPTCWEAPTIYMQKKALFKEQLGHTS